MTDAPDEKVIPFANFKQKRQGRGGSPGGPQQPPPGQGKDSEGLAAGYWRENGCIWMAFILNAVVRAKVPLAYGIEKTGLTKVGDRYVFALPSGVIEADGKGDGASIVVWRGGTQYGRVRQGGKREGWISEVAAPAARVPLAMTAIGTMLSGPALPYLPEESESNTMEHLVGKSGGGKTTIVRVGASVHGKGSQTTDPDSYLNRTKTRSTPLKTSSWPTTISESVSMS